MARKDIALASLVTAGLLLMFGASAVRMGAGGAVGPLAPATPLGPPITLEQVSSAGLSLHEAMFYEKLEDGLVRCRLCPLECTLAEGQRGPCKVRANFGGTLYTLVYGKPVVLQDDAIEKKPLFHVLPGTAAFSLSTVGCNLGCIFCQNWQTSQVAPEEGTHRALLEAARRGLPQIFTSSNEITPAQLIALAKVWKCKSIAYTYTEASIYYEYMYDTAKLAREEGLKNLWITCGYINPEPLRELCKYIDAANVDLKGFSEEFYQAYCKSSLAPVLRTLEVLKEEGIWFEITNLVIPDANDDPGTVRNMCKWIVKELGAGYPLHFSRFYPNYRLTDRPPTPLATLKRCAKIAREEGLYFVYIGNVHEAPDLGNTFCPNCGKLLIRRVGYIIAENHIKDGSGGRCPYCDTTIPGIFPK
jgi:pyruvate formate lyase activating enzyme